MSLTKHLAAALVVAGSACALPPRAHAQAAPPPPGRVTPLDYIGVQTRIPGLFVTPIPYQPFTAEVSIVSHEKLPDGSEHVVKTTVHIARNYLGAIYNERRRLIPGDSQKKPALIEWHIYDPTTRVSNFLDPLTHLAKQQVLVNPDDTSGTSHRVPTGPNVVETDLGTQRFNDMDLRGLRKSRTIPADRTGTGKPIVVVDDYWYSTELGIDLIIRHEDPRTGEQIVAAQNLKRGDPPQALFRVPDDYKVVDITPVPQKNNGPGKPH